MTIKSKSANILTIFIFAFSNAIFAIFYIPGLIANPQDFGDFLIFIIAGLLMGLIFALIFNFFRKDELTLSEDTLSYKNFFSNRELNVKSLNKIEFTRVMFLNPFENIFGTSPYMRLVFRSSNGDISIDYHSFDKNKLKELLLKIINLNADIETDNFVKKLIY